MCATNSDRPDRGYAQSEKGYRPIDEDTVEIIPDALALAFVVSSTPCWCMSKENEKNSILNPAQRGKP